MSPQHGGVEACEICREREAAHKCPLCGRSVCAEHWLGGRCLACGITSCEVCFERLAVGYCKICGRLVCEGCSVELGVERFCRGCYQVNRTM